jgi:adenylate cyclase
MQRKADAAGVERMASFFRSISTKIFGIAVGLLLVMLLVSFWSAEAIHRVNRQLATLSESTVPLALTIQDLRSTMLDEYIVLERHRLGDGDDAACKTTFDREAAIARTDLRRASANVTRGLDLAITERNKLELARLQPLVGEMVAAHDRYIGSALRVCAARSASERLEAYDDNRTDAQALRREIDTVSTEIDGFTRRSAMIVEGGERNAMAVNLLLIGVASVVGLFLAYLVSRGLTRPIQRLREGARAVEQGQLDRDVIVTSRDEIGDVTRAFNEMLAELRAKERIKETFGQYVDPRVVAQLIGDAARSSSGSKQIATLFFSDIAGFTPIAERLAPAALVTLVNDYFATMSAPIRERQGIIDKYIGDSIMAFWVPPFVDAAIQATHACEAALDQFEKLRDFRVRLPDLIGLRRDIPHIDMRVAICTGEVVVGSIGPDFARSFTVMGDTVNFASRLEGANKVYGTHILIDEATASRAGSAIAVREVDLLQVVGRSEPLRIYELMAMAGQLDARQAELLVHFDRGAAAYRAGAWADAEAGLAAALAVMPDDGPSRVMLERVRNFAANPPVSWDGVWRMTSK